MPTQPRFVSGKQVTAMAVLVMAIPTAAVSCSSSDTPGGGAAGGATSTTTTTGGGTGGWGGQNACLPPDQQTSCIRDVPSSIAPPIDCTPKKAGSAEYDGCTPNTPCGPLNGCPLERCDGVDGVVEATYAAGPIGFTPPTTLLPPAGTEMQGWMTGWFARGDGTLDTGSCSYPPVRNLTGVALSVHHFGQADWCGACAEIVSRSGKRVRVQIVDQCTGCKELSLDVPGGPDTPLSMLEDPEFGGAYLCPGYDGSLPISWHIVPCETEGGVRVWYIEGFNAWTPAIRLGNFRLNVVKLEENFGGEWKTLDRQGDNKYFLTPRQSADPVDVVLRITALDGSTITATLPSFEPKKLYEMKAQF